MFKRFDNQAFNVVDLFSVTSKVEISEAMIDLTLKELNRFCLVFFLC